MEREREDILDLIVRWEEAKAQGQDLAPEDLCRECPDLLTGFRRQVAKLGEVAWLDGTLMRKTAMPAASAIMPNSGR